MLYIMVVACLALLVGGELQNTGEARSVPELVVATDIEIRPALEQAIEEFSREVACAVRPVWVDLEQSPPATVNADVLLWQEGERRNPELSGAIEPGTERVLARKRLAVLTRQGNPKAVAGLADLGKPGLRVALAGPEWTSLHRATKSALQRAGLSETLQGKVSSRLTDADRLVGDVRAGGLDAAVGWNVIEGLAPTEIDAQALPEELADAVSIRAAVLRRTGQGTRARSFVEFLASVVGQAVLGRYGYHVELHDAGADAYEQFVETRLKRTFAFTATRMINESGITRGICVDIGCGTGQLDVELAKSTDLTIVGVDIDPEMIEIARRRVEDAGLSDRVSFVVGDVHKLPLAERYADLVVSRGSLLFWKDKVKALREIHRTLKPSGVAVLGGRYLFTPARFKMSDAELEQVVAKTGIPGISIDTFGGQWVRIVGPEAPQEARRPQRTPHLLAGRFVGDYGVSEGDCLLLCMNAEMLMSLQQGFVRSTDLEIIALLPSRKEVETARERIRAARLDSRITCEVGAIGALPFAEARFDVVAGAGPMLIFERDKENAMRELYRVLRPGGVALVGGRYLHMPAFRRVSTESLRQSAARAGLSRVRVLDDGGQWVEIRRPRVPD